MIPDQSKVLRLTKKNSVEKQSAGQKTEHTPFIMGIKEAGSVDMEASSRKTTGKSIMLRAEQAAVIHVVQI
jgi:hypothetical protein